MAVAVGTGLFMGNALTPQREIMVGSDQPNFEKIRDILTILDHQYVDSVNSDELFEQTISDMLHKLDPHSNYIPAKDLKAMNESIEGKFGGVGIRFFIIRDTVCVTHVLSGSPSERAGLKAGDRIISVDGKKLSGKKINTDDVMGVLKGDPNTSVKIRLQRGENTLHKTVIRGSIPITSILSSYMIDKRIGYIKIERFSVETSKEFKDAARKLKLLGMKELIVDLRFNGGGVLTGATEIADEFLKNNLMIVETKGLHSGNVKYRASAKGDLEDVELAILINESSASASEILAGAIQDNDRGVIIGRRSFGKGLVQEDQMLRDGSNLRLTVARYYTPVGRCIQKPYSKDFDAYYHDQIDRIDNGELYKPDTSLMVDSLKYETPKGKTVYGGGGIMPDVFVPYDSTGSSWYLTELSYGSAFTMFAFDYVNDKRDKWKSPEDFAKNFVVTDEILKNFANYALKELDIKKDPAGLARSKRLISKILKGEIARQLFVEEGYYQSSNPNDKEMIEAIKYLKSH